ncbi:ferredoxin reductase family protein [Kaistia adipata]|uniref:ferredoxin reductase family protein n=1 Tax=Kaistia adipata TaxID=166954 RepID=UPI0003F84884|nr:ferric reductase-like transmembrane domain-containing protein [Kaistia adipata]
MRVIGWVFWIFIALFVVLWAFADSLFPTPFSLFDIQRRPAIQLTGILAIATMSFATLLAARPKWLEPYLGGLDKMYRLHRWLGIGALVFAAVHWWYATGRRMLFPPTPAPGGAPRPRGPGEPMLAIFEGQRGLAHVVGEWSFYIVVALIAVALIRRIPYGVFAKTHMLITAVFLALLYHSAVLVRVAYWTEPVGILLAAVMLAGLAGAAVVLARRLGLLRPVSGTVISEHYYPELRVIETEIELQPGWAGHVPGQFAFVTTNRFEGAHPFSIASAWNPQERRVKFIAKELGDFTTRLRDEFRPGSHAAVEGPYGCFTFSDTKPHQVWIGAGVGISPFVARMKYLAEHGGDQIVHLFHSTADVSELALAKLSADAAAAGVRLHLIVTPRDPHLTGDTIREQVEGWRESSYWFCGPEGFGASLKADLVATGIAPRDFHQEVFAMR